MISKDNKNLIIIFLTFIAACIETDIYLPAFPDMMEYFNESESTIYGILTWNFVGLCLSGPFYGPLSDSYGRRVPLLVALGLFFLGSLITALPLDFSTMLVGRVLQGLGAGGCFTLGSTIIFDVFKEEEAVKVLNRLNVMIPLTMSAAPLVGGYLNIAYGFRSNFLAIAVTVGMSLLATLLWFEESHPLAKQKPFNGSGVVRDFGVVLKDARFWQLMGTFSLLFSGYLSFISGIAFFYKNELGMSEYVFPFYQGFLLLTYAVFSIRCNSIIDYFGALRTRRLGAKLCFLGIFCVIVIYYFFPRNSELLTLSMVPIVVGFIFVQTPYFQLCMELYPEMKGVVASLITSMRLIITATIVGLSGVYYEMYKTMFPVIVTVVLSVGLSLALVWRYERNIN